MLLNQHASAAAPIKDVSQADFAREVIAASKNMPVIVDFWAPWCEPCKALAPLLAAAVRKADGRVCLVKVNIEESPELAQQLRIQSIPTVMAFFQGQPIDGFTGQVPASEIDQFIERLTKASGGDEKVEDLLEKAREMLQAGDSLQAGMVCEQILQSRPDYLPALVLYLRCLIAKGDHGLARRRLDGLPKEVASQSKIIGIGRYLDIIEQAKVGFDDIARLQADPEAWSDLATAYLVSGQVTEAFALLLDKAQGPTKEAAKAQLLTYFDALGANDPDVKMTRKALSRMVFS